MNASVAIGRMDVGAIGFKSSVFETIQIGHLVHTLTPRNDDALEGWENIHTLFHNVDSSGKNIPVIGKIRTGLYLNLMARAYMHLFQAKKHRYTCFSPLPLISFYRCMRSARLINHVEWLAEIN